MINTLSILLYKSNGYFSTVHTASQAELEKELLCRSNDLRRKSCYVPKVVFKNECTLSIECSPAKCIYGHNLFEVSSTDLECFLGQLCLILEKLGIYTTVDKLRNGHCWRVDYAKLIHLPFPTDTVVDIFLHTTPHGKQKKYVTNYCKGGRAISNCLKRRKSTFYDKKAEFLSDRNNEKHTLKEVLHHIPGSLWRYEFSAKTAKEIKRELINAGSEIAEMAYDNMPTDATLDNAERLIFNIAQQKTSSDLVSVKDLVLTSYEQISYRYEHRDELMTSGLQKSDLIILAARPSMGKTALALNIAQNVALKARKTVAIFSLEMSKEQLVQRMLCSEAEVDTHKLKTGNMQASDWEKLTTAMNHFADAPLFIDDKPGATVMEVRAKCRRLALEQKEIGLVVIDYLQLMEASGNKEDRTQQISGISRGLKSLARELNVPVIALSQLSRAVESRPDKRPMMSDLRESGAIEQDADIIMFIYRDEYYNKEDTENRGKAEVIVAKHRNGAVGSVDLLFQGSITKFKNVTKTNVF